MNINKSKTKKVSIHKKINPRKVLRNKIQTQLEIQETDDTIKKKLQNLYDKRLNKFEKLNKNLTLLELTYKRNTLTPLYRNVEETKKEIDNKHKQQREQIIKNYNTEVKEIDTEIKNIRIKLVEQNKTILDKRLGE